MSAKFQSKGERDLFEQFQEKGVRSKKNIKFTLPRLRKSIEFSYENIIFLSIAFIMLSVMFFSLGVEKGRQEGSYRRKKVGTTRVETVMPIEKKPLPKRQRIAKKRIKSNYAIQLAAFTSIISAEEETKKLKKEGYSAKIRKSGSYFQVFLDGFDNRKKAEALLKKLVKKYGDGYIKKMKGD